MKSRYVIQDPFNILVLLQLLDTLSKEKQVIFILLDYAIKQCYLFYLLSFVCNNFLPYAVFK